jgi:hypothetical protein
MKKDETMLSKPKFWLYPLIVCFGLAVIILSAVVPGEAKYGYADSVLAFYDSGAGPIAGPYGGTYPGSFPVAVSTNVVLGDDSGSSVDFLSLPTGSYVIVGFTDETVYDASGYDIYITEVGGMGEQAAIYVSSDLSNYTYLGTATDNGTTALDLSTIGYTQEVKAVKIVGLDSLGDSPGFDVVNVQAYSSFSRYDFNYKYSDNSGDYYTGYVYAPTSFAAAHSGWISVGTQLTKEPAEMGDKALGGYYEITAITEGFDASYDKKEYITSYFDANLYNAAEGVNADASTTAATVYVADRTTTDESGYVVTKAQINYSSPFTVQSGHINADNNFSWDYKYEEGFFANFSPYQSADAPKLWVEVDIQLTGDDPGALKTTWYNGILSALNNQYKIKYGTETYAIEFMVDWVTSGADQIVTVHNTTGHIDMLNWYTTLQGWASTYQGVAAAHEYAHMLGLYDEYAGGATNGGSTATNTLMSDYGPVKTLYYNSFLTWLQTASGKTGLSLVSYSASGPTGQESGYPYGPTCSDLQGDSLTSYTQAAAPDTVGASAFNSQALWSAYMSEAVGILEEEKYL